MTKRAYKYRFYPTPEQEQILSQTFGCVRFVYNSVLRWRTDAFYQQQLKVGYVEANAQLSRMKKDPESAFLSEVSSVPLQQCLRHQSAEFTRSAFSTGTASCIWPKAKPRWIFAGAANQ